MQTEIAPNSRQLPTFKSNKCGSISDRGPVNCGLTQLFPIETLLIKQKLQHLQAYHWFVLLFSSYRLDAALSCFFSIVLWNECFYLLYFLNSLETCLCLIKRKCILLQLFFFSRLNLFSISQMRKNFNYKKHKKWTQ